jgi:hypothetical protein
MTKREAVQVQITEGNEAYTQLAELTAHAYERHLDTNPDYLLDGKGNCWVVAASAYGVAQALGFKSSVWGGSVRNIETGKFEFGGADHFWVEVDRDVIIESPNHKTILVTKRGETGVDYIKVRGKAKGLMPIAAAVRDHLLKVGADNFVADRP